LQNVLIDKGIEYFAKEENRELVKDYNMKFVVGVDIPQRSFDENCADFCLKNNCDFLTVDLKAYHHFFKIKSIKFVQISEFYYEKPPSDRWVYRVQIVNEKKDDLSKGVKLD